MAVSTAIERAWCRSQRLLASSGRTILSRLNSHLSEVPWINIDNITTPATMAWSRGATSMRAIEPVRPRASATGTVPLRPPQ